MIWSATIAASERRVGSLSCFHRTANYTPSGASGLGMAPAMNILPIPQCTASPCPHAPAPVLLHHSSLAPGFRRCPAGNCPRPSAPSGVAAREVVPVRSSTGGTGQCTALALAAALSGARCAPLRRTLAPRSPQRRFGWLPWPLTPPSASGPARLRLSPPATTPTRKTGHRPPASAPDCPRASSGRPRP